MPDYKRLVSYMYNYEDGVKRNNVGYARVEARNGQCKCTLHITAPSINDKQLKAYMFKRKNGGLEGILLGVLQIKNGIGDYRVITDQAHIMNSSYSLDDMGGIVLYLNERKFFATEWDDSPVTRNMVAEIERKATEKEKKSSQSAEAEVKAANVAVLYLDSPSKKRAEDGNHLSKSRDAERLRRNEVQESKLASKPVQEQPLEPVETIMSEESELHSEIKLSNISGKEMINTDFCGYQYTGETSGRPSDDSSDRVTLIDDGEGTFPLENLYNISPQNENNKVISEEFNAVTEYNEAQNITNENAGYESSDNQISGYENFVNENTDYNSTDNDFSNYNYENQQYKNQQYENAEENANTDKDYPGEINTEEVKNQAINEDKAELQIEKEVQSEECKREEPNRFYDDHPVAKRIYRSFPRMYPFEDNEIAWCVKIEPQDIGLFPMEVWILGNNSFLLHGYYSYRHLIFAKINDKDGFNYILGVPGIYHNREKFMAKMFGFENFKCVKRKTQRTGEFGYWYVPIVLN